MPTLKKLINYLFATDILLRMFKWMKAYFKLAYKIGWQSAYLDVLGVMRRLWFFYFFQLFLVIAFFLLPQGSDILQCLLEDFYLWRIAPLVYAVIAMFLWASSAEFGTRMLLYLSDKNTVKDEERREFRRQTQKLIPALQAVFPFVLYIAALSYTFCHHYTNTTQTTNGFLLLLFILLGVFNVALRFFFGTNALHNLYFHLSDVFQTNMTSSLVNILDIEKAQQTFSSLSTTEPDKKRKEYFAAYSTADDKNKKASFRSLYPLLYKRLKSYIALAAALFLIMGFIAPQSWYYTIGTPALLTTGISCWLITFYSIKIMELIQPFKNKWKFLNLPYTSILLIWVLIVSYCNDDHPIRYKTEQCCSKSSMYGPAAYFEQWLSAHKNDVSKSIVQDTLCVKDSLYCNKITTTKIKIPILLIGAEGGALRTGAFTSMLLGKLQDSFPDFKNKIVAFSTVSGGTFGANLFNATAYRKKADTSTLFPLYKNYFENTDFIAPIAAKLMFGDFINYFIPHYFQKLDREVALEEAWENSWSDYLGMEEGNKFYENFYEATGLDAKHPAVFINSVVAESGDRAIISNMLLDTAYFKNVFDLNQHIKNNISYATAISLSARFPLVSPAAKLDIDGTTKVHLVDGGYYDNCGHTTMIELLNALSNDTTLSNKYVLVPMVLQTVFDSKQEKENKGISFMNELSEIVAGIYNTRSGHTNYAKQMLQQKVKSMGGSYLEIAVANGKEEVPNNWVLSKMAVKKAHERIQNQLLNDTTNAEHKNLMNFLKLCGVKVGKK